MKQKLVPGRIYFQTRSVIRHGKNGRNFLDSSYFGRPVIFVGYTPGGRMRVRLPDSTTVKILPPEFSNGCWKSLERPKPTQTSLSKMAGKMVRRVRPVRKGDEWDFTYCDKAFSLVEATKENVIICDPDTKKTYRLGSEYADPGDWMPAYPRRVG